MRTLRHLVVLFAVLVAFYSPQGFAGLELGAGGSLPDLNSSVFKRMTLQQLTRIVEMRRPDLFARLRLNYKSNEDDIRRAYDEIRHDLDFEHEIDAEKRALLVEARSRLEQAYSVLVNEESRRAYIAEQHRRLESFEMVFDPANTAQAALEDALKGVVDHAKAKTGIYSNLEAFADHVARTHLVHDFSGRDRAAHIVYEDRDTPDWFFEQELATFAEQGGKDVGEPDKYGERGRARRRAVLNEILRQHVLNPQSPLGPLERMRIADNLMCLEKAQYNYSTIDGVNSEAGLRRFASLAHAFDQHAQQFPTEQMDYRRRFEQNLMDAYANYLVNAVILNKERSPDSLNQAMSLFESIIAKEQTSPVNRLNLLQRIANRYLHSMDSRVLQIDQPRIAEFLREQLSDPAVATTKNQRSVQTFRAELDEAFPPKENPAQPGGSECARAVKGRDLERAMKTWRNRPRPL